MRAQLKKTQNAPKLLAAGLCPRGRGCDCESVTPCTG